MANEKPPFMGACERRTPTCHAECRDYGEYAAMLKAKQNAVREAKAKSKDWTQGKMVRAKMNQRAKFAR